MLSDIHITEGMKNKRCLSGMNRSKAIERICTTMEKAAVCKRSVEFCLDKAKQPNHAYYVATVMGLLVGVQSEGPEFWLNNR
jgi:hypothetical protein